MIIFKYTYVYNIGCTQLPFVLCSVLRLVIQSDYICRRRSAFFWSEKKFNTFYTKFTFDDRMLNELEVKIQKKGEENEIFALLCLLAQGRKFLKKREN